MNFSYGDVYADALVKVAFLTLTTQTLPICIGENCSVDDLLNSAVEFHNAVNLFRMNC